MSSQKFLINKDRKQKNSKEKESFLNKNIRIKVIIKISFSLS